MSIIQYHCPQCRHLVTDKDKVCTNCGCNLEKWKKKYIYDIKGNTQEEINESLKKRELYFTENPEAREIFLKARTKFHRRCTAIFSLLFCTILVLIMLKTRNKESFQNDEVVTETETIK